jgi:hypothetical protein
MLLKNIQLACCFGCAVTFGVFFGSSVRAERYTTPGSLRVQIAPELAIPSTQWRVLTDDGDGDGPWREAGDSQGDLVPGAYRVEFRSEDVWAAPAPIPLYIVGGTETEIVARVAEITAYAGVSDIPPLDVRHGDTLSFSVGGAASIDFDAHPDVKRAISFEGGRFDYTPSDAERLPFDVTFEDGDASNTVTVTPRGGTPAEHSIIEFKGDFPYPEATERKTYLSVFQDELEGISEFHHRERRLRDVSISGIHVVIERGHENGLFESLAYVPGETEGNDNLRSLEIFADTLTIRERLRFPETDVTIWARVIRFEDPDTINTAQISTQPFQSPTPSEPSEPPESVKRGLTAGTITLHVGEIEAEHNHARFVTRGGKGQAGREGADRHLDPPPMDFPEVSAMLPASTHFLFGISAQYVGRVVYLRSGNNELGTHSPHPRGGLDATPNGIPGPGGDGADYTANIDLPDDLVSTNPGRAGDAQPERCGSDADRPYDAVHLHDGILTENFMNFPGLCAPATSASGPEPSRGTVTVEGSPTEWVHPVVVRSALEFARDAYLNGYPAVARQVLDPYFAALNVVSDWPEDIEADLTQLRSEIATLYHRLDNNLDYFGYPAGWVPMLSFEVTRQLFEDQVAAAGDLMYLSFYLGKAADEAVSRVAALSRVRAELSRELEQFRMDLEEVNDGFDDLERRSEALDGRIRARGRDLRNRVEALQEEAKRTVALKKAFRIVGSALPLIPVAQPALGLAGAALTAASKFNEQSALDSTIEGTNLASAFLQSNIADNLKEFNAKKKETDPKTEAFRERQQALQNFDDGLGVVNGVLQEAKTWDADVDNEVQILAAEDPQYKALVGQIRNLNAEKRRFAEDMAVLLQLAKQLMDGINQNTLALDNLSRDAIETFAVVDQQAFRYIKEIGQRARERLLEFQYYMVKAYAYRTLRSFDDVDPKAFQLEAIFDHFAEHFTNEISDGPGDAILLDPEKGPNLVGVYSEQLQEVTRKMVSHLVMEPPEQTETIFLELDAEELAQLNAWDDSRGKNPGEELRLNLVDRGGLFDQRQENQRIFELAVEVLDTSPGGEGMPENVTVHIAHSGESLLASKGETYRFNHYRTLGDAPITWRALYNTFTETHTSPTLSAAGSSLLKSLLEEDAPDDLLLYSRPSAWADLVVSKETLIRDQGNPTEMNIDRLVLRLKVDFSEKESDQAELTVSPRDDVGDALAPTIVIRNRDNNGRSDGAGEFLRRYRRGEQVTLDAPRRYGSLTFAEWTNRGEVVSTEPTLELALPDADRSTVTAYQAVYRRTTVEPTGIEIQRGDSNADGVTDVSDALFLLNFLFLGGAEPSCQDTADFDDDGQLIITDGVALLNFRFNGVTPPGFFGGCRIDDTPDTLPCESYDGCGGN